MPDEIVVPDWLIDLYAATVGQVPGIDFGDGWVIPGWLVFLIVASLLLGLLSGWGQQVQRRREREELLAAIAARQRKVPGPHGTGDE